jgi:ABC-type nitrate/sulfonate/bicarbonate transport system ATPase subunit
MKIQLKNISKSFQLQTGQQLRVLENINLDIEEGDFLIILGESGCGKSTLLNLIAGLMPASSGEITTGNGPITAPHPSRILLFQHPSLLPWLNVEDNIVFGCKLRGDRDNLAQRTRHYIELMGLTGVEKIHPPELSVGMAHRVALARALIGNPDVLLLDEPFRSLDTMNSMRLLDELINIWKRGNFTAVFVTHNIEEAIMLGNKIVLLGGKPTGITEIFAVDLDYPRDIAAEAFMKTRATIFLKAKETYGGISG